MLKSIIETFQDALSSLNREALLGNRGDNMPILKSIKQVNWYGQLLRRLCGGAALRTHLENINQFLADLLQPAPRRRRLFKAASDGGLDVAVLDADEDVEDPEVDEGNFEVDSEYEESTAEHQIPWLICHRWLKLLIAQFDAANNLVGHIALPDFPTISAKILRNPPGTRSLMEWKELLNNPKYFPRKSVMAGRDRSNVNIISSLERAISGQPYKLGSLLQDIQVYWQELLEGPKTKDRKEEIASYLNDQLCKVEKSLVPGCQVTAGNIRKNIEKWLENSSAPNPNSSLSISMVVAGQINDQINSMLNMCHIFSQFDNPMEFSGTVHCEANLANYLSHLPSLPDDEKLEVGHLVLSYNSYSYQC